MQAFSIHGALQDGSNKSFFPHGFHHYIYAESLVNRNCDYEAEMADYFSAMYGNDWEQVKAYLWGISDAFGEKYMHGEDSADPSIGTHYNPDRARKLEAVAELTATALQLAKQHRAMPTRPQTVAYRLLERHAEYCQGLAEVFTDKALGHNQDALEKLNRFTADFGKYDYELENQFDFNLAINSLRTIVKQMAKIEF